MATTAWRCAFCNKPGKPSVEHVIAEWISSVVAGDGGFQHRHVQNLTGDVTTWSHPDLFTITNTATCERCNSEWMSNLETRVKSILAPLIKGDHGTIEGPATQLALSTWAIKTAMMLDLSMPGGVGPHIPPRQLRYVYDRRHPPASCSIYLFYYERAPSAGEIRVARYERTQTTFTPSVGDPRKGYVSTFSIGHVVFQVIGYLSSQQRDSEPRRYDDRSHRALWPLSVPNLVWPPEYGLNDEGLDALPGLPFS